jgi:hypothetical protein
MVPDRIDSRAADTDQSAPAAAVSRRGFLRAGAATGGGLLLSLSLPFGGDEARAANAEVFAPNAFIRIEGNGQIVLTMPYVEMGQGTYTSIPMLIAEELEVELKQVRLEHAPPNEKLYANPLLGGRPPATRTRSAVPGSRCARPAPSREPCWCRVRPGVGASIRRPAARKMVKCFTCRPADASDMAHLPPAPPGCPCPTMSR